MNFHNLQTVAAYNARLLLRSWLFRIFFLLTFCCIILYQVIIQSNLFFPTNSGLISLSSFFPFMNAYLFTGLQVIPLIFLAGMFLTKERRLDSMDTIYYRPESNAEYVVGMAAGFVRVFVVMAVISLFLGFLLNLFASDAPLSIGIYFFYLLTLIIPALIFMLGFSFFIHSWVRNQALSILLLLIVVGAIFFYGGEIGQGIFDPFGHSLPNTFSGITGHPDLTGYLLQRLCWVFVGFGFLGFSICLFKRLSNRPVNRVRVMGIAVAFMIAGIVSGGIVYSFHAQKVSMRNVYTETYNKYNDVPKGTVVRHDISFEQQGNVMTGKSTLVIQNRTGEVLPEIVLYLNPALDVLSIEGDTRLPFERDRQVIRVQQELQPGQEVTLGVAYKGGIDERVCYLDVPDNVVFGPEDNAYLQCRYGKRFMYLDKDFTFLTPECLWYPTTLPPVNPASSYNISSDFTLYTLRVMNPGERTVVAQGDEEKTGDGLYFTNTLPLPGLSLCMGDYKKRVITVDSVRYELYLTEGQKDIFRGLEALPDSLAGLIREIREAVESRINNTYPYSSLKLIETPVTLTSFFRQEKGTSELIQPEMIFLPERGLGFWSDFKVRFGLEKKANVTFGGFEMSDLDRIRMGIRGSITYFLAEPTRMSYSRGQMFMRWFGPSALKNMSGEGSFTRNNLYYVGSMFYDYSLRFHSDDYPVINNLFMNILSARVRDYGTGVTEEEVQDYLSSHSLEEALYDRGIDPVVFHYIIKKKAKELVRRLALDNITEEEVVGFLRNYAADRRFQRIDFNQFDEDFAQVFHVRWRDILPSWYTNKRLPEFLIKDFKVQYVKSDEGDEMSENEIMLSSFGGGVFASYGGKQRASQVSLFIFNDSDVDGVITVESAVIKPRTPAKGDAVFLVGSQLDDSMLSRNYLIKAKSGKEIVTCFDEGTISLNTNLSSNIPMLLSGRVQQGMIDRKLSESARDIDYTYFLPAKNEIVVDNEDDGFRIMQSSPKKRLRDMFAKERKSKYRSAHSLSLMDGVEVLPGYMRGEESYGLAKRTHAFMMQGGGASMEWTTRIEREGEYDVYAYFPPKVHANRIDKDQMKRAMRGGSGVMVASSSMIDMNAAVKQHYRLENNGEKKEAVGEGGIQAGWVLLGRFRLTPGECKVILTDEGETDQVLLGDAIRWKYVEDK